MNFKSEDFYEVVQDGEGWRRFYVLDLKTGIRRERNYAREIDARRAIAKLFNAEMKKVEKLLTSQE